MSTHFILVDFENVQPTSLGTLKPDTCQIHIFFGQNQSKVPLDLTKALQPFGDSVRYLQITGNGPNALDFHIAFYIGRLAANHAGARFTIVSKDAGFDPLIKHLATLKIACRRVKGLNNTHQSTPAHSPAPKKTATKTLAISFAPAHDELMAKSASAAPGAPQNAPTTDTVHQRTDEVLARLTGLKHARPAALKTLRSSITSWFNPKLTTTTRDAVVQRLLHQGHIKLTGNKVSYSLESAAKK